MSRYESYDETSSISLDSPHFKVEFDFYWKRLAAGMDSIVDKQTLSALKAKSLLKEHDFFEKCFQAIEEVHAQSPGTTICLFDIDGTIGEVKDDDSDEIYTLLRPSVPPLISSLAVRNPESLRFGLISLRPQSSLNAEMENPTFLAPVRAFMDDQLVYSSELETKTDPLITGDYDQRYLVDYLRSLDDVIDEAVLTETASGRLDIYDWYDPKIRVIAGLLRYNPAAACVIVDDLPYTRALSRSNNRLRGVCVDSEKQILIPD